MRRTEPAEGFAYSPRHFTGNIRILFPFTGSFDPFFMIIYAAFVCRHIPQFLSRKFFSRFAHFQSGCLFAVYEKINGFILHLLRLRYFYVSFIMTVSDGIFP